MLLTLMLGCPPAAESGKAEPAESVKTVDTAADSVGCVAEQEVCDGVDNDCDGAVDEEAADAVAFYADGDGDGYGEDATVAMGCAAPADEAISDSCLRRAGDTDGDGREDLIVSGRMPGISYMYIFYDFEKGTMISSEAYGFKIIGGYCGPTSDVNSDGLADISISTSSMIA